MSLAGAESLTKERLVELLFSGLEELKRDKLQQEPNYYSAVS